MNEKTHYLYLITREDGEQYVGVTSRIEKRINEHRTGYGNIYLRNSNFKYEILESGSKDYIYSIEDDYIIKYDAKLNRCKGGIVGGAMPGEYNPSAVLTANQVIQIKESLIKYGKKDYKFLAEKFNVAISTISRIANNQSWIHTGEVIPENVSLTKREDIVSKVDKLWNIDRLSNEEISTIIGVDRKTIYDITKNWPKEGHKHKTYLSQDDINKILELRRKNMSYVDIAKITGISEHAVSNHCSANNLGKDVITVKRRPNKSPSKEDITKMVQVYSNLKNISKTAIEVGFSRPTVKKYLEKEGVL